MWQKKCTIFFFRWKGMETKDEKTKDDHVCSTADGVTR